MVELDAVQEMLFKLALQMASDDYETRRERQAQGVALLKDKGAYAGGKSDKDKQKLILSLRAAGNCITDLQAGKVQHVFGQVACAGAKP